jgi:Ca2+-binding RTX toxin-like protein
MKTALVSLVAVAVAGVPGVAAASTVAVDRSGTVVYKASAGEANKVELVSVFGPLGFADRGASLIVGGGCTAGDTVSCPGGPIAASLGDRDDAAVVNSFSRGAVSVDGGSGDDDVLSGANDNATASGGSGDDTLVVISNTNGYGYGGSGSDQIAGRSSGDHLFGGDGADLLAERPGFSSAELWGGDGADRLVGNLRSELSGGSGSDILIDGAKLDGGSGADRIQSAGGAAITAGAGNDAIDAADGSGVSDTISCGSGFDAVWADPEDTVARDCELRLGGPAPALPGVAAAEADAAALLTHVPAVA